MFRPVVPEVCLAATSSQEIHGYVSVVATFNFTYCLIKGIIFCEKSSRNFLNWLCVYISCSLEYLIKNLHVPTNRTIVKGAVTYRMVLVCIRGYLISVLGFKFLILHIIRTHEQGCEDSWLFFEAKRVPRAKKSGKHWFVRLQYNQ
jgi:hypothetical protein